MLIPILSVRDMREAIAFYTEIVDFRFAFAWPKDAPIYAGLLLGTDELHLALAHGDKPYGRCSAMVLCDDIDALFAAYVVRGLSVPTRPESPPTKARSTRAGAPARSISTIPAATR